MTRFEGEEVHNKDNGIKVGPDGRPDTIILIVYLLTFKSYH